MCTGWCEVQNGSLACNRSQTIWQRLKPATHKTAQARCADRDNAQEFRDASAIAFAFLHVPGDAHVSLCVCVCLCRCVWVGGGGGGGGVRAEVVQQPACDVHDR